MIANDLWQKNGGTPQPLAYSDYDSNGTPWARLFDNETGRLACGWIKAPDYPDYDFALQAPVWEGGAWMVVTLPVVVPPEPEPVMRRTSRIEFLQRIPAEKRIAIRQAGKTDLVIEDFLDLLSATDWVELDNDDTVNALTYIVGLGLLTFGDVAVIRA